MRTLAITIAVVCSVGSVAHAETPAELTAQGEELAKQGRLTQAIEVFKKADRIEPRARHACLIALAYIRRELWPQAEVFLTTCHDRASADDPLPDWVPLAEKQLVERLSQAQVAAVAILVKPDDVAATAQIAVSSFAPDELFPQRTIHLAPGKHLITVTAPGRDPITKTIEINSAAPRELVMDFDAKPAIVDPPPPIVHRLHARPHKVPWAVTAIGGAMVAGGAAFHLLAFKPTRDKLADAADDPDPSEYNRLSSQFDTRRTMTIAMYGVGAAVLITGVVLRYTKYADRDETAVRASAVVLPRGMVVGLEWRR